MRQPKPRTDQNWACVETKCDRDRFPNHLYMNGPRSSPLRWRAVPPAVTTLLERAGRTLHSIDLFVFHQANRFMLEHLRGKLGIPQDKFVVALSESGNTVSATIPIALKEARARGQLGEGQRVMLVGFGVGYSWGATLIRT